MDDAPRKRTLVALEWIESCRRVAQHIESNPPFPPADAIDETQSNDVQLLVKLLNEGKHEQKNAGEILAVSGELPTESTEIPKDAAVLTRQEPGRMLKFFSLEVPIGPLIHTWTELELIARSPQNEGRVELTFRGKANSIYRVEYKPSGGLTPA
jgi:hypothetical protein